MLGAKGKRKGALKPLETGSEVMRSLGEGAVKETKQIARDSATDLVGQLLGLDLNKTGTASEAQTLTGETTATQTDSVIFDIAKHKSATGELKQSTEKISHAEAAIDYHRNIVEGRKHALKEELNDMQQNIEQIKLELSKLVASSQLLKLEFSEVTVEQQAPTIGQYHLNFYEWMLAVIRSAREKVEDSGAWLGVVKGKGHKKNYWDMFKKHGTTFGLSGERTIATNVG